VVQDKINSSYISFSYLPDCKKIVNELGVREKISPKDSLNLMKEKLKEVR
jgi:hypothetical protein